MRRIDALGIGLGVLITGGLVYTLLLGLGLDTQQAGIWSQGALVLGFVGWLATYFRRVVTQKMTYNQQLDAYEDAVLQKRLDAMSPEELAALQADLDPEEDS
jgi:membrane protein implicated in regulation of membrane protease activity